MIGRGEIAALLLQRIVARCGELRARIGRLVDELDEATLQAKSVSSVLRQAERDLDAARSRLARAETSFRKAAVEHADRLDAEARTHVGVAGPCARQGALAALARDARTVAEWPF
jgi:chromosome segregation ATPase